MPARIQPNRPYYPRYYLPRGAAQSRAAAQPRGGGRGAVAPGGIDTTPTGSVAGDLVKAINATIQQHRQNAAANQILNTQTPPRAAWVGGTQPGANVPLTGTAPQTGGTGELQMRQQQQQQDAAAQRADLADQLTKAKIATELARAKGTGGFAKPPKAAAAQKPQKYEPLSSTPDDPAYYNFNNQRADIDTQYGKNTYDKLLAASGKIEIDPATGKPKPGVYGEGNDAVTVKEDGSISLAKGATIPADDLSAIMARYDATKVRQGGKPSYTGQYLGTQNPQTGEAGGSSANPYTPKTTVELNALPSGTWFVNPNDGKTYQKGGTQQGGQKTSQVDTGDQGTNLALYTGPEQPITPNKIPGPAPMPSGGTPPEPPADFRLAGLTPGSAPGSFDLGQSPTGGLPQDTDLADAIARARAQNQLTA